MGPPTGRADGEDRLDPDRPFDVQDNAAGSRGEEAEAQGLDHPAALAPGVVRQLPVELGQIEHHAEGIR